MKQLIYLLLALTVLVSVKCVSAQTPPQIQKYQSDELVFVNVSVDSSKALECPSKAGFYGVTNRDNSKFIARSLNFGVDLSYQKGNFKDLQRMRNEKLGAYHCLYIENETIKAHSFILSEKPPTVPDESRNIIGNMGQGAFQRSCPSAQSNSNPHRWEIYNETTGLFDLLLKWNSVFLNYAQLVKNEFRGFTIYRCFDENNPEKMHYYLLENSGYIRQMRPSNYTQTIMPTYKQVGFDVQFECKSPSGIAKTDNNSVRAVFYLKKNGSYLQLSDGDYGVKYDSREFTDTLIISSIQPENAGVYKCVRRGAPDRVKKLVVEYGNPSFIPDNPKIYWMNTNTNNHSIGCTTTNRYSRKYLKFVVKLQNREPFTLPDSTNGTKSNGFSIDYKSDGAIRLHFQQREDAINATVECHLVDRKVQLVIKPRDASLKLEISMIAGTITTFTCTKLGGGANRTAHYVHILNSDGSLGGRVLGSGDSFFHTRDSSTTYMQYICVEDTADGKMIRSNVVEVASPNVMLDIYVEGQKNPEKSVFLDGGTISIVCSFANMPYGVKPQPSRVSLMKDGNNTKFDHIVHNDTNFQFWLRNAAPWDSGKYQCVYGNNTAVLFRASVYYQNSVRSPESTISICTSAQFVCDKMCRNRSLLCDGNKDCADGSDEAPENCQGCEPNQVKCQAINETEPKRNCILKHWLCDGSDDCGNGYDEAPHHGKWCFKEPSCTGCQPGEVCCPTASSDKKCISRSYECDKEKDCNAPGSGGASEEDHCQTECLKLIDPTSRRVITKKVGDQLNLTCIATGAERPTINWRLNWAAVPMNGTSEENEVKDRTQTGIYKVQGTLQFTGVTKAMAGIYNCEAVNNCDRKMSPEIELRVED